MAKLQGLTGNWIRFPHLAQELMDNPDKFLSNKAVKTEDYACPEEVHEAIGRGERLGQAIAKTCQDSDATGLPLNDCVKQLRQTVAKHFGEDFVAETIPFGVLFKERAKVSGMEPSFTGTGSCTFCKDNDSPDTD